MSDLPLPEARVAEVVRMALHAAYGDNADPVVDDPRRFGVSFADGAFIEVRVYESGHRAVWSAEEVEPLIEALVRMIDWHERGDAGHGRENYDRFNADMFNARAALARVRGPELEGGSDG